MRVPLFATGRAAEEARPEIAARVGAALASGRYILGNEVAAFESEFAAHVGVPHCVGVNSGTDALTIGLRALGIGRGDEVVVPALTFYATAEAVVNAGARPVFADVEEGTWVMTAETAEAALGEQTRALLPVHLFGNPAPMDELVSLARDRGLRVLEDAAQAAGAKLGGRRAGALGDAAAFSFYPSKNLGAVGDAGALVTADDDVAALARRLRHHGSTDKQLHTELGYNSRLDELQAAALRAALPRLDGWNERRRAAAAAYDRAGLGDLVELPRETPGGISVHHLYVVSSLRRERLEAAFAAAGIGCRRYYATPLYRQPALAGFAPPQPLPGCERFAERALAIPMGPDLGDEQVERVVEAARDTA